MYQNRLVKQIKEIGGSVNITIVLLIVIKYKTIVVSNTPSAYSNVFFLSNSKPMRINMAITSRKKREKIVTVSATMQEDLK